MGISRYTANYRVKDSGHKQIQQQTTERKTVGISRYTANYRVKHAGNDRLHSQGFIDTHPAPTT